MWLRNVCRCIEWREGHRKGERLPTTQIAPDCEEHTHGVEFRFSSTDLPLLMALISSAVLLSTLSVWVHMAKRMTETGG